MPEIKQTRPRWGWESAGDARRVNLVGDWSFRLGFVGIGVLFLGMMLALTLGDGTATKVAMLWIAAGAGGLFGLAGFLLGMAGIQKARNEKRSARSAAWGLVLALLLGMFTVFVYVLTVWVRH